MTTVDYKMCYVLSYKVWQNELQCVLAIRKCGRVDYKVGQGLQSVELLQSELVQQPLEMFCEKWCS